MAPKLYMIERSPPVMSVLMTAKMLGIQLQKVYLDFDKGEHLTPEFLKMNPLHSVPTLNDNGKILIDSHAINVYLVEKYAKEDLLYPKDPYKRAIIDQRLHFNSSVMYTARTQIFKPIRTKQTKSVPPEKAQLLLEAYGFLDKFLEGHDWFAGDRLTLADLCLIPTVTFNDLLVRIEEYQFPKLTAWMNRVRNLPCFEINQNGLDVSRARLYELMHA